MKFDYHFEPETGWINDPNGLCYYKGQYHAFFQYNPYAPWWDTMHWGHAISEDMIAWKQINTALFPDCEYENDGGCFSGSAIEKDGNLHLYYTAVSKQYGQAQATAVSEDGIHFVKDVRNPIIRNLPFSKDGEISRDFRDPKVFRAFGKYYMVVGACKGEEEGQVLLYSSADMTNWQFKSVVYASCEWGGTLECPDMFPLGDRWVLMFSAMKPTVAATVFVIGNFDGQNFTPERVTYNEYGKDFYAPQSFAHKDGRRIMIGWFYHWGKQLPAGAKVAGALSIPRELSLQKGNIMNYPVKEARHLFRQECDYVKIMGTTLTIWGLDGSEVYKKDFLGVNGVEKIEKVDILFDKKAVEIFINDGIISVSQWLI